MLVRSFHLFNKNTHEPFPTEQRHRTVTQSTLQRTLTHSIPHTTTQHKYKTSDRLPQSHLQPPVTWPCPERSKKDMEKNGRGNNSRKEVAVAMWASRQRVPTPAGICPRVNNVKETCPPAKNKPPHSVMPISFSFFPPISHAPCLTSSPIPSFFTPIHFTTSSFFLFEAVAVQQGKGLSG